MLVHFPCNCCVCVCDNDSGQSVILAFLVSIIRSKWKAAAVIESVSPLSRKQNEQSISSSVLVQCQTTIDSTKGAQFSRGYSTRTLAHFSLFCLHCWQLLLGRTAVVFTCNENNNLGTALLPLH